MGRGRRKRQQEQGPQYSPERPFEADARVEERRTEKLPPSRARRFALAALRRIPSHRDTRSGRSNARQFKIVFAALAILLGGVGETVLHMVIAALLMLTAFFLPLADGRKRAWSARLRSAEHAVKVEVAPARVRFDGKRIAVLREDKVWRRVLIDRSAHSLDVRRLDGEAWLGVIPASGRKAESLWFVAREAASDLVPLEAAELDQSRVDHPVCLDGATFRAVHDVLRETC